MSTALQTKSAQIKTLIEGDKFRQQIEKALPRHLPPDRFIRIALTALTRTPKLPECTQASLFKCLLDLSALGIEPDGRRAHLIPYENRKAGTVECQLIIDYKGLAELAMRSGVVANIHADVVCDNDEFAYNLGEIEQHRIDFRKPRGNVFAAYAVVLFKDGTRKVDVLSRDEIESVRKRSKAGSSGPWVTDWNEMAKKTAFRRLSKWLPLSPEYRDALDRDADSIAFENAKQVIAEPAAPRPLRRTESAEPVADPEPETEPEPDVAPIDNGDDLPYEDAKTEG